MKNLENISVGTAGIALRQPTEYKLSEEDLYVVKYNKVEQCSHNQY